MIKRLYAALLVLSWTAAYATPLITNSGIAFLTNGGSGVSESITCAVGNSIVIGSYGPTSEGALTISGGSNTFVSATGNPIQETNNFTEMYVWWVVSNATANPTITISIPGSGDSVVAYYCISGANTSSFVDAQSAIGSPNTGFPTNTAFLSNPVTTTASNDLVLSFAAVAPTTVGFTVSGSGWTVTQSTTAGRAAAIGSATPGTGSTNPSWVNSNASGGGDSFTLAIKANGGSTKQPGQFFFGLRSKHSADARLARRSATRRKAAALMRC